MLYWVEQLVKRSKLRMKILVATILVVGLFTGLSLYQTLSFYTKSSFDHVSASSQSLLESTYGGIRYPMSVGMSKTVEEQLKHIKNQMEGVEVYITDIGETVSYASEEERINTRIAGYLWEEETQKALAHVLKTGVAPKESFMESRDEEAFLVTIKPLFNEVACHHCHGASKKVLGAMVVKHPVTEVLASLASARNRLILVYLLEIIGIILLINFLFNRLVTRRIHKLAKNTDKVSAGDVSVEIHDDSQDSIGRLTRNFNEMIKSIRDRMEYANSLKNGISDPFFMVDPDMKITYINPAAARLAGVFPGDVHGKKTCREVFKSEACKTGCHVKHAMETGEPVVGRRHTVRTEEGGEIPVIASGSVLKDSTGKILGGFEIMRIISKEVKAESLLRESYLREEEAKEKLERRVEVVSNILEKVAEGDLSVRAETEGENDAMDKFVQRINNTLDRMEELIGQTKKAALIQEEAKEGLGRRVEALSDILRRVAEGDLLARAELEGHDDAMDQLARRTNETLDEMKDLIGQTKKAALTVVSGVKYISEGNQELSQRTQEQAATVEETSATVAQIVSSINQNVTNTQRADNLSKEAVAVALEGGGTVEKTIKAMNDMSEGSRKIVEMMDLINEITFQTNLLSVNAAVEAARAGEQGRGFAVVASEVRNLAKRSSEASKNIQALVLDIMNEVSTGKEWVAELENGFSKIVQTIKEVSDALSDVSIATQESSRGIEQIGQAVHEMGNVIEHNASLVDELATAAEHLNEKAGLLKGMTERFTLGDDGEGGIEGPGLEGVMPFAGEEIRRAGPRISSPLREGLAVRRPIEDAPHDLIDEELEDGFEEF